MKRVSAKLVICLFLICNSAFGQKNQAIYAGIDIFRDKGFEGNTYGSFSLGSQLFRWKFIAPEVGYEHYFGTLNDYNALNQNEPQARAPFKIRSSFTTNLFTVAPKLVFGSGDAYLVIVPQYNIGELAVKGEYLVDTGNNYALQEQQNFSESVNFWSIAAGIEGDFFNSDLLFFSLLLKYQNLNTQEPIEKLQFQQTNAAPNNGSTDGLGVTLRVYVNFIDLLKRNKN